MWMQDKDSIEDVAPAAHEKPSESSPKDNDVQDSEDVANKEGQHQMTEDEQVLHDELEKMTSDSTASPRHMFSAANLPIDLNMPDLEDDFDAFACDGIFSGAYDDENVGCSV
ncbi:hypothetical protein Tco_0668571 [Tanacetum coccineum]